MSAQLRVQGSYSSGKEMGALRTYREGERGRMQVDKIGLDRPRCRRHSEVLI